MSLDFKAYTITGRSAETRLRTIVSAAYKVHSWSPRNTFPYVWRGQASSSYRFQPAIHTVLESLGQSVSDANVVAATESILAKARRLGLDIHEGMQLPDMALLARLQHYGVATPLLDVTYDPVVALYMAAVAEGDPSAMDHQAGMLFAVPISVREDSPFPTRVEPYDDRPFHAVYTDAIRLRQLSSESPSSIGGAPMLLVSPVAVTDRILIQRGVFVLGAVAQDGDPSASLATIGGLAFDGSWVKGFMDAPSVGGPARTARPADPAAIVTMTVPAQNLKRDLRSWIQDRSQLTPESIYPPAWHEPHLEAWAKQYGRKGHAWRALDVAWESAP